MQSHTLQGKALEEKSGAKEGVPGGHSLQGGDRLLGRPQQREVYLSFCRTMSKITTPLLSLLLVGSLVLLMVSVPSPVDLVSSLEPAHSRGDSSRDIGTGSGTGLGAGLGPGSSVCWSSHTIPGGLRATADASGTAGGAPGRPGDAWGVPWAPGAVVFQGQCGVCQAGALCDFHMVVRSPAHWAIRAHPRQRELRVVLEGPSQVVAHALHLPPLDGSAFQITYQLWDPGMYRVSVRIPCRTLKWRDQDKSGKWPQDLATWQLLVVPPQGMAAGGGPLSTNTTTKSGSALPPGPSMKSGPGGAAAPEGVGREEGGLEGEFMARPCEGSSLQARWLRQGNGSYKWTPYECSKSIPVQDWIPALNKAGIKEISFIGDSHQRLLAYHITYLIAGWFRSDPTKKHASHVYDLAHPGGGRLRINSYFIKGIFFANDAFGCDSSHRENASKPEFPAISPTADVNILDAGFWTGFYCKRSELAFAANLPSFLLWMEGTLRNASLAAKAATQIAASPESVRQKGQEDPSQKANPPKGLNSDGNSLPRRGLSDASPRAKRGAPNSRGSAAAPANAAAAAAPGVAAAASGGGTHVEVAHEPLLVYRSTPPRATDHKGCNGITNVYVDYANELARGLVPELNAAFFDSSAQVEGPRYLDVCDRHHFSCPVNDTMVGEVGEAVAFALVHFLIREQHKRHPPAVWSVGSR